MSFTSCFIRDWRYIWCEWKRFEYTTYFTHTKCNFNPDETWCILCIPCILYIECPEEAQNVMLTGWKLYSQNNFKRTVSAWSVNLLRSKRWFKEFFLRTMPKGALCSFFSCKLSEFFAPFCNPGQWPSIFQVLILNAVTSCIYIWINLNGALLLYQP